MKKNLLFWIVILILIVVMAGIALMSRKQASPPGSAGTEQLEQNLSQALEEAGQLPEINTNPLEKLPEVNPVDRVNPFNDVQTNPFR